MVKTSPSNAGVAGSIPGQRAKIPHAAGPKNQNIKQKQYCNKFSKDFKTGPHQKIYIYFKKIFFNYLVIKILLQIFRAHCAYISQKLFVLKKDKENKERGPLDIVFYINNFPLNC